jgi:hypothetical protein
MLTQESSGSIRLSEMIHPAAAASIPRRRMFRLYQFPALAAMERAAISKIPRRGII